MADNSVDLKYDLDATREDVRAAIDRLKKNERSYWRSKARALYQQVIAENWYGAADPPPKGTLRSVDVLRENLMYYNLTRGLNWFAKNHGFEANFKNPTRFMEKMLVAKFFAPIPMPSPGDKLGLSNFIPPHLRDRVRTAKCVWSSPFAEVPRTFVVPAGTYYFKANHGSGFNIKVELPLSEDVHAHLNAEAERWLAIDYGINGGEWWYGLVQRKIYLEESFSAVGESANDWKFFVLNGRVSIVQVDIDRERRHKQLIYDRDFNFLEDEFFYRSGTPLPRPANYTELLEAAEAIGSQFEFARVDFYNTSNGIVLGEITLAPGGARQRVRSPRLDDRMGRDWQSEFFGKSG